MIESQEGQCLTGCPQRHTAPGSLGPRCPWELGGEKNSGDCFGRQEGQRTSSFSLRTGQGVREGRWVSMVFRKLHLCHSTGGSSLLYHQQPSNTHNCDSSMVSKANQVQRQAPPMEQKARASSQTPGEGPQACKGTRHCNGDERRSAPCRVWVSCGLYPGSCGHSGTRKSAPRALGEA